MRFVQVNVVCGTGSTGRIVTDICRGAQAQGDIGLIGYGRGSAPQELGAIRIGTDFTMRLHGAYSRVTDRHGLFSAGATKGFLRQVEAFRPDIVHLHNIHGYYLHYEVLFDWLGRWGGPVVWTLHDCWAFTGHCAYYTYQGCDRWRTGCFACPQKKEYPKSLLLDASRENYRRKRRAFGGIKGMRIVTPSRWLAGEVEQSFLGEYPVQVIPNGIDLEAFRPVEGDFRRRHGLEDKLVVLGVAGVWDRRKGLGDFIRLAGMLPDRYRIVLVGLSEKQLRGLPANVVGLGRTASLRELAELYSTADVFVNPSYEDTLPTTNIEAFACGTPVVAFSSGGNGETVPPPFGRYVPPGNTAELLRVVASVAEAGRVSRDEQALEAVSHRYARSIMVERYRGEYHTAIQAIGQSR